MVLNTVLKGDKVSYANSLSEAFRDMSEGGEHFWRFYFWRYYRSGPFLGSYITNSCVHFSIDTCASVALLIRIDHPWIRSHAPLWLTGF